MEGRIANNERKPLPLEEIDVDELIGEEKIQSAQTVAPSMDKVVNSAQDLSSVISKLQSYLIYRREITQNGVDAQSQVRIVELKVRMKEVQMKREIIELLKDQKRSTKSRYKDILFSRVLQNLCFWWPWITLYVFLVFSLINGMIAILRTLYW